MTPTEAKLWRQLRDRRVDFKFRRQHPVGRFVLDFFCPEVRLAVEVEGDQHAQPKQDQRDRAKAAWLAQHGIRVMRVPVSEAERSLEDVVQAIWQTCRSLLLSQKRPARR